MCAKQLPDQWAEIMPRVVHIHGKFYGFDANGRESAIDFERLVKVFVGSSFTGYMSSEWEGHAFTDRFSGFDMVSQHQALCRRALAANNQQPPTAIAGIATKIS